VLPTLPHHPGREVAGGREVGRERERVSDCVCVCERERERNRAECQRSLTTLR
jgi:hypothetical protein